MLFSLHFMPLAICRHIPLPTILTAPEATAELTSWGCFKNSAVVFVMFSGDWKWISFTELFNFGTDKMWWVWGMLLCLGVCSCVAVSFSWPKSLCASLHFGTKGNRDSIHLCLLIHCNPVQTSMYNSWFTPHIQPWRFLWRRDFNFEFNISEFKDFFISLIYAFFFWAVLKNFVACDRIVKKKLHLFRFSPKF